MRHLTTIYWWKASGQAIYTSKCTSFLGRISIGLVSFFMRFRFFFLLSYFRPLGTRFLSRGVDIHGEVSNCYESEMVLMFQDQMCSFVQLRGSVPMHWEQDVMRVIRYPVKDSQPSLRRHFEKLQARYGKICILNLLESTKTSPEAELSWYFSDHVTTLKSKLRKFADNALEYHHNNYYGVAPTTSDFAIIDQRAAEPGVAELKVFARLFQDYKFFHGRFVSKDVSDVHVAPCILRVLQEQSGAFRTNCLDCMDRTNYIQTCLSLEAVSHMLAAMVGESLHNPANELQAIIHKAMKSELKEKFLKSIVKLWSSNGNAISNSYCGSDALSNLKRPVNFPKEALGGMVHQIFSTCSDAYNKGKTISQRAVNSIKGDATKHHGMQIFYGHETYESTERGNLFPSPNVEPRDLITDWLSPNIDKINSFDENDALKSFEQGDGFVVKADDCPNIAEEEIKPCSFDEDLFSSFVLTVNPEIEFVENPDELPNIVEFVAPSTLKKFFGYF